MTRVLAVVLVTVAVLFNTATFTMSLALVGLRAAQVVGAVDEGGSVASRLQHLPRSALTQERPPAGTGSAVAQALIRPTPVIDDGQTSDPDEPIPGGDLTPSDDAAIADGGDDDAGAESGKSVPAVDWPTLLDLDGREPLTTTKSFAVYVQDEGDALLLDQARRWAPELEGLLGRVEARTQRAMPLTPVHVVFSRAYQARCPARGLATPRGSVRRIEVYVDDRTSDVQVRAVLAHEIAHHVTITDEFVGDHVLSEGLANWSAADEMLAWQGIGTWDEAVREYLAQDSFVAITDPAAQNPVGNEDCLARRDRVYNARTSFVSWMVGIYGIDMLLAMPCKLVPVDTGDPDREPEQVCVPDYVAATGADLATLEERWLEEVRADR